MGRWRDLPYRSGVSDAEIALRLPGDDVVPHPTEVVDRAATFAAPPEDVWPWIAQLGKGRAGWYFPLSIEKALPRKGLRHIDPALQDVRPGDEHDDWGPGNPKLRVTAIETNNHLVYDRIPPQKRLTAFSWALVLRPEGTNTRLHLRIRMRLETSLPVGAVGGLFDWATVELMFRGLRERLQP